MFQCLISSPCRPLSYNLNLATASRCAVRPTATAKGRQTANTDLDEPPAWSETGNTHDATDSLTSLVMFGMALACCLQHIAQYKVHTVIKNNMQSWCLQHSCYVTLQIACFILYLAFFSSKVPKLLFVHIVQSNYDSRIVFIVKSKWNIL